METRKRPNRSLGRKIGIRITEEPSLYGLLLRENGEAVEYVSYSEARLRVERGLVPMRGPARG